MIRIIDHEGNGYGAQAEITRRKGVNGEKSLTGVIYTNEEVLHGVDRGWKLEFENEMYAFTFAYPKDIGNRIELDFDAVHEFFYDMSKSAQNDLLNDGSHTFRAYLDFIFDGTRYNYSLDTNVQAFEKQTFGQRNRLDLFYDVINTAGVEFSVSGSVVRIVERVGNDLSTVVKKGFNLNELRLEKNIGDFVTYQKGFGAWNDEEDHSKGRLEVEYLSPLAEIYGQLDADPIVDERYTVKSNLENRLKSNVEGSYQISVQIDMEDLTRAGYEYKQPHEGDSIMAINKDLGFQRKVRIVSYETDFDVEGNILDHRITCNSVGMVEESILSNNSIKNSIKELQTDLELTRKQVIEFNISADGKSTNYYGPIEPSPDDYKLRIGDTWFDSSGEDTIVKVWNGVEWRKSGADVDAIRREVEQAQQDIAAERQRIDVVVDDVNTAVSDAGFTSLSDSLTGIQQISQTAQSNAENALTHSLNAISDASTALSNSTDALSQVANIDVRVDDVEGTLELKADKQEVDTLSGIVDTHTLDIKANAEGLVLKANQDTVDTLAGTVQSLGTEFDIVAGQISKKVWNTDIETAIDGIEIGGRNYLRNSDFGDDLTGYDTWGDSELEINTKGNLVIHYSTGGSTVQGLRILNLGISNSGFHVFSAKVKPSNVDSFNSPTWPTLRMQYAGSTPSQFYPDWKELEDGWYLLTGVTRIAPSRSTFYFYGWNDLGKNENLEVEWFKLEKGTKATDWTPAPEDTLARFDHIETEWTQTFDSFSQTVSSIDGRVSEQEQTVSGMQSVVYDPETGLSSLNTQLVNLIQVAVTGEEMTGAISVLEDNLNLRLVAKDEVITQINASTEGILLQADKVQALADVIVDGKLTITDEFIAPNAQIDGAKIADLTVSGAKIISLDVDRLSGNIAELIQAGFSDATGNRLQVEGQGLQFYDNLGQLSGTVQTYYKGGNSGVGVFLGDNRIFSVARTNASGSVDTEMLSVRADRNQLIVNTEFQLRGTTYVNNQTIHDVGNLTMYGGRFGITYASAEDNRAALYDLRRFDFAIGTVTNWSTRMSIRNAGVYLDTDIQMQGNNMIGVGRLHLRNSDFGITRDSGNNNQGVLLASSEMIFAQGTNASWRRIVSISGDGLRVHSAGLNMSGYNIWNVGELNYISDERLKDVLGNRTENDLATIMAIDYKNYYMNNRKHRGFIAQELKLIDSELVTESKDGTLGYDGQGYVHTIGHAVQQLGLKEENTNRIASQALQATETNAQKINRLEKRIEELEGVA